MECKVQLISDLNQFEEAVMQMTEDDSHFEILISGIWNKNMYEKIINQLILSNCSHKCKIIIPGMSNETIIPRYTISKLIKLNSQIRVTSKSNSSMLVIGDNVFVPSFSYRQEKNSLKTKFECCMITDHRNVVNEVRNKFISIWESSLPLISEVV